MSGPGGLYSSPRNGEGDLGLERGEGWESQHVAAITGMLARMVCSSTGNASLSLPALPQRAGCISPPEAKISPAAPCWEAVQLEKGSTGGRPALQPQAGGRDGDPSLGTARSSGKPLAIN